MNKLNNKIKDNFTIIPNDIIRNKSLSDRARFIFCYMASMPDDWKFYQGADDGPNRPGAKYWILNGKK